MEITSGIERNTSSANGRATFRHLDTWIPESRIGKVRHEFKPTFEFPAEVLGTDFTKLIEDSPQGMLVRKIKGWLGRADAQKIYELAYFTDGAILELGTYQGLATSVIATAIRNSGREREFTTVDHNASLSMS